MRRYWFFGGMVVVLLAALMLSPFRTTVQLLVLAATGSEVVSIEQSVVASTDDAEEYLWNGTVLTVSDDLEIGYNDKPSRPQAVGIRFAELGIPAGAVIDEAYLHLMGEEDDENTTAQWSIRVEKTATSQSFVAVQNNITSRAVTDAEVVWENIPEWNKKKNYTTPDVRSVVQEVVALPDWTEQSALTFIITGDGERSAYTYDDKPDRAAVIQISYHVSDNDPDPIDPPPSTTTGVNVSLAFDDGLASTYELAAPILNAYDYDATVYVYPQAQDDEFLTGFMSWEQIEQLQNEYGWEIGSHSYAHAHLTQLSQSDLEIDLQQAHESLQAHGINDVGFASPYGEYNEAVLATVKQYHEYHRTAFGGVFNSVPVNPDALFAVDVSNYPNPTDVFTLIDQAVAQDMWLILYWHDLVAGHSQGYSYNVDDFETIVSYLAAQQVSVGTVAQGVDYWTTVSPPTPTLGDTIVVNGSFEMGSGYDADGWLRNDGDDVRVRDDGKGIAPEPTRYVRITGDDDEQVQISSQPMLIEYDRYQLSFYSKLDDLDAGSGNVWISEFNASGAYIGGQYVYGVTLESEEMVELIYTPTVGTATIELFFFAPLGADMKWYIDGVVLQPIQ